jgi:hypothetical protein
MDIDNAMGMDMLGDLGELSLDTRTSNTDDIADPREPHSHWEGDDHFFSLHTVKQAKTEKESSRRLKMVYQPSEDDKKLDI